jgi:hypothetical protein
VAPVPIPVPKPLVRVPPIIPVPVVPPIAFFSVAIPPVAPAPVVVPPIPPPVTPVPPGGATASAQATARREEKARKHASQSAYVIRPAGSDATEWFFPAVGVMSLLAVMLIGGGLRPGPKPKYAYAEVRDVSWRRGQRPDGNRYRS